MPTVPERINPFTG
ncbi:hypothetical protein AYI69_g9777, partial [Smittium culicis]